MVECTFPPEPIHCDEHGRLPALCTHAAADLERRLEAQATSIRTYQQVLRKYEPILYETQPQIEVEPGVMVAEYESPAQRIATLESRLSRLEEEKARLQRYPFEPICLICGALTPRMTETDLKPDDPGVPCMFDPTPRQLFDQNATLRERLAQAAAREAAMREALNELWMRRVEFTVRLDAQVIVMKALSPDAGHAK